MILGQTAHVATSHIPRRVQLITSIWIRRDLSNSFMADQLFTTYKYPFNPQFAKLQDPAWFTTDPTQITTYNYRRTRKS